MAKKKEHSRDVGMKMKLPIRISDVEPLLTNFSKNIGNTFPPEGFYVTIRNDVLLQTAKKNFSSNCK